MTVTLEEPQLSRTISDGVGLDEAIASFSGVRPRLVGIAYRILGDWSEAEDLVQDVWVRWQRCDRGVVRNSTAFLVTTTTRLALNVVQTARVRHQATFDERLPELADCADDPAAELVQLEALERGVLLLCERLAPSERAAFVLRVAFDYPYHRIAGLLRVSEANARQLVSRAGRRVACDRVRSVDPDLQRQLTQAILAATRHGSVTALEQLLVAGTKAATGTPCSRTSREPSSGLVAA